MEFVESLIVTVPDFPKPGIQFKDITPILANAQALNITIGKFVERYQGQGITKFVGIESRGFIFAAPIAQSLSAGLVLARKPGKLPRETHEVRYALEYGEDSLQIHRDDLSADDKVVIIDDLLATGGTAKATVDLCHRTGCTVAEVAVVIELAELDGRARLHPTPVSSLLSY